jgi:two-component system, OmpR family, KDP operon response regulator KdpE
MEVLRRIRAGLEIPVIVVSARGNEKAKVDALDGGADDYLSKPFGTGELLARIRVSLRHYHRSRTTDSETLTDPVHVGPLLFDAKRREVHSDGRRVHLTPIEFRLLEELVRERGKVLTHAYLVARVWGPGQPVEKHNVRVFMATLRRKLESPPDRRRIILTEVGIGYRLRDDWETDDP